MLKAYLDESGQQADSPLCVIAGFLAPEAEWELVADRWKLALGTTMYLHTAEFLRDKDYARNLKFEEKSKLLRILANVMIQSDVAPVVSAIHRADYEALVKGRLKERYTSCYMLCAQVMVAQILGHLPPDEKVCIVFEHQPEYVAELDDFQRLFSEYRLDPRLISITAVQKGSSGSSICLEPADYLAYAARHCIMKSTTRGALATQPILYDGNVLGTILDRELLARFVEGLKGRYEPNPGGPASARP